MDILSLSYGNVYRLTGKYCLYCTGDRGFSLSSITIFTYLSSLNAYFGPQEEARTMGPTRTIFGTFLTSALNYTTNLPALLRFHHALTSFTTPITSGTPTGPNSGKYTAILCSSGKYTCPTILFSKNAFSAASSAILAFSNPSFPPNPSHALRKWRMVVRTPSATGSGIEMDGKWILRRAREPIVPEALRRRPADRTRTRVIRRSGRELLSGAPSRDMSWFENTNMAGRKSSMLDWIITPPHCGISQLFPPPSTSMSPT